MESGNEMGVMLSGEISFCFFFNDTATTEIYTLSLHDALPISSSKVRLIDEAVIKSGVVGLITEIKCSLWING